MKGTNGATNNTEEGRTEEGSKQKKDKQRNKQRTSKPADILINKKRSAQEGAIEFGANVQDNLRLPKTKPRITEQTVTTQATQTKNGNHGG